MYHGVDGGEAFQDLAVDAALGVAFGRSWVDGLGVFDVILDEILFGGDGGWRNVAGHDEAIGMLGVPD